MNHFKSSLVKFSAVAALSLSGIATITLSKPQAIVQAATSIVRVNYVPGYSIAVWNSYQNGHTTGQYLKDGTSWKVIRTTTDSKGNKWYDLGSNQWVMAKYMVATNAFKSINGPSAIKIDYVPGYSIAVWSSYSNGHTTGQYLKNGSSWKVIRAVSNQSGQTWYDLGSNQWIMAKYTSTASAQAPSVNTASKVVNIAHQELGKPYAWGAAGPYSFDCSGLVQYVFKQAGVSLPRTTWTQATAGTRVSLGALKPGDLLFFDNTNHVAIYIGGNQYIDAPTYGEPVRVQSMSAWYPQYAVRVL